MELHFYSSNHSKRGQCMDYLPYLHLPVKRATYYDFVLIDGICKHYAAYYVIILITDH